MDVGESTTPTKPPSTVLVDMLNQGKGARGPWELQSVDGADTVGSPITAALEMERRRSELERAQRAKLRREAASQEEKPNGGLKPQHTATSPSSSSSSGNNRSKMDDKKKPKSILHNKKSKHSPRSPAHASPTSNAITPAPGRRANGAPALPPVFESVTNEKRKVKGLMHAEGQETDTGTSNARQQLADKYVALSQGEDHERNMRRRLGLDDRSIPAKKEDLDVSRNELMESLVIFSMHAPRCVLGDITIFEHSHGNDEEEKNKIEPTKIQPANQGTDDPTESDSYSSDEDNDFRNSSERTTNPATSNSSRESSKPKSVLRNGDTSNFAEPDDDRPKRRRSVTFVRDTTAAAPITNVTSTVNATRRRRRSSRKTAVGDRKQAHLRINDQQMLTLPHSTRRRSALLFVDVSGFTKLSTILDVESLSRVINDYFDSLVNEVMVHGGDVLKFAGDAFFAEWQVDEDADSMDEDKRAKLNRFQSARALTARRDAVSQKTLAECVSAAAFCGASIVAKHSDFEVSRGDDTSQKSMLNVHCGLGAGNLVGLHVGNIGVDGEDPAGTGQEQRREFLFLGSPIDQVSVAAEIATDGELIASPYAIRLLATCCNLPEKIKGSSAPSIIAKRDDCYITHMLSRNPGNMSMMSVMSSVPSIMTVKETIAQQCRDLNVDALTRLRHQLGLYVHPVVRGSEHIGRESIRNEQSPGFFTQTRNIDAELRSVFTMFITAKLSSALSTDKDNKDKDFELFRTLSHIMSITSRELDRFSGHLRQFIVDDKGVVLIATFGLRGSTFPNMVANNALPATLAIHAALKTEINVDNRIGATYGKVYCGIVGGTRRHEFAVMGAPVNLAARLMCSEENKGILVDEGVQMQAGVLEFKSLPPVRAKGYANPVPIFEPTTGVTAKKKGMALAFVGRGKEKKQLDEVFTRVLFHPEPSMTEMVYLYGDSGVGKTALTLSVLEKIKEVGKNYRKEVVITRAVSSESEQLVPLSVFRHIFLSAIKEYCFFDGTVARPAYDDKDPLGRRMGSIRRGKSMTMARARSMRHAQSVRYGLERFDSTTSAFSKAAVNIPFFQKLCWICEQLGYAYEFADIIGARLLGLEEASGTITAVDGVVPTLDDMVEFLTLAFERFTSFSDLSLVILDDFQWIDPLSWKVIRSLKDARRNLIVVCAARSHDKQAMRRMSSEKIKGDELRLLTIDLGPLDTTEMREMIAMGLGYEESAINSTFANDIYEQTGGLPVYAIEYVESIKRSNLAEMDSKGIVGWRESASCQRLRSERKSVAVIEELFLNRFDSLSNSVRRVIQTCAVLGVEFSLLDVLRVHSDDNAAEIEKCLEVAVAERILLEETDEDDDDDASFNASRAQPAGEDPESETKPVMWNPFDDRFFQFSHGKWRDGVLQTMLKEKRRQIHQIIAETMEADGFFTVESSDTTTLLKLFDHWKACGQFLKAAPLALAIGFRLEEWDSHQQSLDLYQNALSMWRGDVGTLTPDGNEIMELELSSLESAPPAAIELIIRLYMRIGKCGQSVGDQKMTAAAYQNAYEVLTMAPGSEKLSRSLVLLIIGGLCLALSRRKSRLEEDVVFESTLVKRFVSESRLDGNPIHMCLALAMEGLLHARVGFFEKALASQRMLQGIYSFDRHNAAICRDYGRDFAAQSFSDSVQWYFLIGDRERATELIQFVIQQHLPKLNPREVDNNMALIFPLLVVMKTIRQAKEAEEVLRKYVINRIHEFGVTSPYWQSIYDPLVYLLDIIQMEDAQSFDESRIRKVEQWALRSNATSFLSPELRRDGLILVGEICYRLAIREVIQKPRDDQKRLIQRKGTVHLQSAFESYNQSVPDDFMAQQGRKYMKKLQGMKFAGPRHPRNPDVSRTSPGPQPAEATGCSCTLS